MRIIKSQLLTIVKSAVAKTFADRTAAYKRDCEKLGDAVYAMAYGEVEIIAKQLPQGWVLQQGYINILHPSFGRRASQHGASVYLTKWRHFPRNDCALIDITGNAELSEQAEKLANDWAQLQSESTQLRSMLTGLIANCTTREKLMTVWPEGEQFFPTERDISKPANIVPHELALTINKLMGLLK